MRHVIILVYSKFDKESNGMRNNSAKVDRRLQSKSRKKSGQNFKCVYRNDENSKSSAEKTKIVYVAHKYSKNKISPIK